jgi:hypothetical protein
VPFLRSAGRAERLRISLLELLLLFLRHVLERLRLAANWIQNVVGGKITQIVVLPPPHRRARWGARDPLNPRARVSRGRDCGVGRSVTSTDRHDPP